MRARVLPSRSTVAATRLSPPNSETPMMAEAAPRAASLSPKESSSQTPKTTLTTSLPIPEKKMTANPARAAGEAKTAL